MNQKNQTESALIVNTLIRIFLYGVLVAGVFAILFLDTQRQWNIEKNLIGELSYTEFSQELLLVMIVILFWRTGAKVCPRRSFGILLSGFAALALCRELDFLFDHITHGFWKVPGFLVIAGYGFFVWRFRKNFVSDVLEFLIRPESGILLCGFLTVIVFSRLSGWTVFWISMMGDGYMRCVKNIVEEGLELLGYLFIAIAAVEYYIFKKNVCLERAWQIISQNALKKESCHRI